MNVMLHIENKLWFELIKERDIKNEKKKREFRSE